MEEIYYKVKVSRIEYFLHSGRTTMRDYKLQASIIPGQGIEIPFELRYPYDFFGSAGDGEIVLAKAQRQLFYHGRNIWLNTWFDNRGSERPNRILFIQEGHAAPTLE